MTLSRFPVRCRRLGTSPCCCFPPAAPKQMDWDLRSGDGSLDTIGAALNATNPPPAADARGVISYPGYQVAVARSGDTVTTIAARVGARTRRRWPITTRLHPTDGLRDGEVLALPSRVAAAAPASAPPAASSGLLPRRVRWT